MSTRLDIDLQNKSGGLDSARWSNFRRCGLSHQYRAGVYPTAYILRPIGGAIPDAAAWVVQQRAGGICRGDAVLTLDAGGDWV